MIKNIIVMLFTIVLSATSLCMEIETDNSLSLYTIPDDCQKSILSRSSLQSFGRLKRVAKKYNQWINFEQDRIEGLGSLSDFFSQDFDQANATLTRAAHGGKKNFFNQIFFKVQSLQCFEGCSGKSFFHKDDKSCEKKYNVLAVSDDPVKNLHNAIFQYNDSSSAHIILASDDYINGCNTFGQAEDLLAEAVRNKNKIIICLLLFHGADINAESVSYFFPLYNRSKDGDVEMVKYLLELGADIYRKTTVSGSSALHGAIRGKAADVVNFLLSKSKGDGGQFINQDDYQGNTPLMVACQIGQYDIVRELLKNKDINVNAFNKNNQTALHYAAIAGHHNIVKLLCERAAGLEIDINHADNDGNTAFSIAIGQDKHLVIEELLKNRVNVVILDKSGMPLQKSKQKSSLIETNKKKKLFSETIKARSDKDQSRRKKVLFLFSGIVLLSVGAYLLKNLFAPKMVLFFTSIVGLNFRNIV